MPSPRPHPKIVASFGNYQYAFGQALLQVFQYGIHPTIHLTAVPRHRRPLLQAFCRHHSLRLIFDNPPPEATENPAQTD